MKTILCIPLLFLPFFVYAQEPADKIIQSIATVAIKDETFEQEFRKDTADCIYTIFVNNVSEGETMAYKFNAADINPYKVSFETKKNTVLVTGETKGGKDLIREYENQKVEGYTDEFSFYAGDVEQARDLVENFKILIKECEDKQSDITYILGQNAGINAAMDFLKSNIQKIEVNELSIDQSISFDADFAPNTSLKIIDETEGETREYIFNATDINPVSLSFDTKNEFVLLEGQTKGERDLIRNTENGELQNYEKEIIIYAPNIETARKLVDAFKLFVRESEKIQSDDMQRISGFGNLEESNDYLKNNVKDVAFSDKNIRQSFNYNAEKPWLATIGIEEAGDDEKKVFAFNLADLNANKISFNTKGSEVIMEIQTNGERDIIKTETNGEADNYENEVELTLNYIEEARNIVHALQKSVELSLALQSQDAIPGVASPDKAQAMAYLESAVGEVVIGEDAYEQSFRQGAADCLAEFERNDVSKGETTIYKFNFVDVNVHSIKFDTKGKECFVEFETKGGADLIEVIENGETDGFESELRILTPDVENARHIVKALTFMSEKCDLK